RTLSDPARPEYHEARLLQADDGDPVATLLDQALPGLVDVALDRLPPQDSLIIRLRYGFDGEPETLQSVGDRLGLTKERIRQRQLKSEQALRKIIREMLKEPPEPAPPPEGAEPAEAEDKPDAAATAPTGTS